MDESDNLLHTAMDIGEHMLSLPAAYRVKTIQRMRDMRPTIGPDLQKLAEALKNHGDADDLIESRRAFAEKRSPNFSGWKSPEDRYNPPTLKSIV